MLRWAFRLICAISLLLFAATIALWVRSVGAGDAGSGRFRDGRYAATSACGRIRLVGPPPPAADAQRQREAEQLVASLHNDQLDWIGWYSEPIDPFDARGFTSIEPPVPADGTPAQVALKQFSLPELARPLLLALENPAQLSAAHVLLVRLSPGYKPRVLQSRSMEGRSFGECPLDFGDREHADTPCIQVEMDGLHVMLCRWRIRSKSDLNSYGVTSLGAWRSNLDGDPDLTELAKIRDQWHQRLDQQVLSIEHWKIAALTAVLPTFGAARVLRRRAMRRRHLRTRHCPICGYDLRASSQRCPECGTPAT